MKNSYSDLTFANDATNTDEHVRLCHHFQKSEFLPIQTKTLKTALLNNLTNPGQSFQKALYSVT